MRDNTEIEKSINKAWAVPNRYVEFPSPVIYKCEYGYNRAKCPIKRCPYDGFPSGFNQHYARKHAPEQWRQHAKRVLSII